MELTLLEAAEFTAHVVFLLEAKVQSATTFENLNIEHILAE